MRDVRVGFAGEEGEFLELVAARASEFSRRPGLAPGTAVALVPVVLAPLAGRSLARAAAEAALLVP